MKKQFERLTNVYIVLILGVGLAWFLLWALGCANAAPPAAQAASYTVCSNGCDYTTIQAAVDAARDGDVIKVAEGIYADVHTKPRSDVLATGVVTQVVYISKTVTIQGGYTTTNWATPYPITQPTILDAREQGRVVYVTGNIRPTIEGLRITGGKVDAFDWSGGVGSGVYIITATATISNNWVFNNTIQGDAAGLYLYHSNGVIIGNNIFSNSATRDGGGLYLHYSAPMVYGNIIVSNTADNGGGVYLTISHAALGGNTITSNIATWSGGGMYLYGSAATVSGNIISGNKTISGAGGGLYQTLSRGATLNYNLVSSNSANWGGGGLFLQGTDATLRGNTLSNNRANGGGGGLYLNHSYATFESNTVFGNQADSGGGLYLDPASGHIFTDNAIFGNTANQHGGGLFLSESDVTFINNLVYDNQANTAGSGLYVSGFLYHPLQLLHTTIARNTGGDGSGVFVTDLYLADIDYFSTIWLTNTILISHTVGISVTGGNTVTINGILWYSTPVTISQATTATVNVQNQRVGDPRFAMDGYHILTGSAAINGGVDAGVRGDIDNQPRPYQTPDLGADEYWPPGALKYVYLPFAPRNVP